MAIIDINNPTNMRSTLSSPVNNTATIKSRIAAANPGDVVYFPSGIYCISGNILDRDATNSAITIVGDDMEATSIHLMPSGAIANESIFKVSSMITLVWTFYDPDSVKPG